VEETAAPVPVEEGTGSGNDLEALGTVHEGGIVRLATVPSGQNAGLRGAVKMPRPAPRNRQNGSSFTRSHTPGNSHCAPTGRDQNASAETRKGQNGGGFTRYTPPAIPIAPLQPLAISISPLHRPGLCRAWTCQSLPRRNLRLGGP
jgi:hypothetical protein